MIYVVNLGKGMLCNGTSTNTTLCVDINMLRGKILKYELSLS